MLIYFVKCKDAGPENTHLQKTIQGFHLVNTILIMSIEFLLVLPILGKLPMEGLAQVGAVVCIIVK